MLPLRMSRTTPLIDFSTVSALWVVCRFSSTGHIQDLCRSPPEACVYYCVLMDFASDVGMAKLEVLVRTGSEKFAIGVRFEAWQKRRVFTCLMDWHLEKGGHSIRSVNTSFLK